MVRVLRRAGTAILLLLASVASVKQVVEVGSNEFMHGAAELLSDRVDRAIAGGLAGNAAVRKTWPSKCLELRKKPTMAQFFKLFHRKSRPFLIKGGIHHFGKSCTVFAWGCSPSHSRAQPEEVGEHGLPGGELRRHHSHDIALRQSVFE
jgi:hypothetical protein